MVARLLLAALVAAPVALRAQDGPERYFPLEEGALWIWYSQHSDAPDRYHRLEIVGDTLLSGTPYALARVTQYDPETTGTCALRLVPHDPAGADIEEVPLEGSAECLPSGMAAGGSGADLPGEEGEPATVTIGGLPYALDEVIEDPWFWTGFGEGNRLFAAGVGMVWGSYRSTGGGPSGSSALAYAEVGGEIYGVNPVASEPPAGAAPTLALAPAIPNPFRTSAALWFELPAPEAVTAAAYDALGRRAWSRDWGQLPAGRHALPLDGAALAPGVYVVRVTAGGEAATQRVVRI